MTDSSQSVIGSQKDAAELPEWAIGPFTRDSEPTLEPTDRGWEAGRIFNLSLIEQNDALFAFYRATPDDRIDQDSRIGLAWSEDGMEFRRHTENPILEPTEAYEQRGCEDPKVYKHDDEFFLFYNCVWESEGFWGDHGQSRCNICLATSQDLFHWEKHGQIVPATLTNGWAKGAVIPHDPQGRPVKIDGQYLMYIGELDMDHQLIGTSEDMVNWDFEYQKFIDPMPDLGVESIHEPASLLTDIPGREEDMIMTFNYAASDELRERLHLENAAGNNYPPSGQALYSKSDPTELKEFTPEPAGSWGGIIQYDDEWVFPEQEGAYLAWA